MKSDTCRKFVLCWTSMLGLMSVSYMFGSAVIFFNLPTAGYLQRAFVGATAWQEQQRLPAQEPASPPSTVTATKVPRKAFDGYTLEMAAAKGSHSNCEAVLLDMDGVEVHKWSASFRKIWPNPPHRRRPVSDLNVCFFAGHLLPNGDLLVVFHGFAPVLPGHGLIKLDRDSNVLWKYSAAVHHDLDVGEDGTVYAIKHEILREMPSGLERTRPPCVVDYLVMLTPDGKELAEPISILEAFRDSPYAAFVSGIGGWPLDQKAPGPDREMAADILHTNCVDVLSRELAPRFPMFEAGQVLISIRELDVIAVLDPQTRTVVWATRGAWRRQHDVHFLDNGHLLIFDNVGAGSRSRVLEFDPQTQAVPWSYSCPYVSITRGMSQRLPNGNTLVVNSEGGAMQEINRSGEIVWSRSRGGFIHVGRRYSPDQLPFLDGGRHARR